MSITRLNVSGYRSVKEVWLQLNQVNVIVGPNGCGKSNLYRAMYLVAATATGQFARQLAEEGGMNSVLWAGKRPKGPVRMNLGVRVGQLDYKISVGLPEPNENGGDLFQLDPRIKEEQVALVSDGARCNLIKRGRNVIDARDTDGNKIVFSTILHSSESILAGLSEPQRFPELAALKQEFLNWRFYHQFRTDAESPIRRPQTGVYTPTLSHDGRDLAANLATIMNTDLCNDLGEAIEAAFPGARLDIEDDRGQFSLSLHMPGFKRSFEAKELSDGTLQYLCLIASLLSVRPPSLIALNEPETSIHPDLLDPLAKLVAQAAGRSQLWITTHSQPFADLLLEYTGANPIELEKIDGETRVIGADISGKVDVDEED